jgi:diguanylate cyclase (GGDEF)-like protein
MNELLRLVPFWLALPAFFLARRGYRRPAWMLLGAMPLASLATGGGWLGALGAATVGGALVATLWFSRRSAHRAARLVWFTSRDLRRSLRAARGRMADLTRESSRRSAALERLQSRFSLVQGMATRLDTGVLLQSLGNLWSDVPGVRRVLLVQRRPNGNWAVAYARHLPHPEVWVHLLEAYPVLTEGRRLRGYGSLEKLPFLEGKGLEPPFFLVPVAWGDDVMAIGCLEVTPALFAEGESGFDTERKLVSIGLRRAYLYDLMSERSRHDGLTGALLRRAFVERLNEAVRKSLRYRTPLFIGAFDIDHFKSINDSYGHAAGDKALIHVTRLAGALSQPGITLGRLGGDEFAFIMEVPSLDAAVGWMERLRESVAASPAFDEGREIRLGISAGVSAFLPGKPDAETLLSWADEALYRSKRDGRNRVSVARPAAAAEKE